MSRPRYIHRQIGTGWNRQTDRENSKLHVSAYIHLLGLLPIIPITDASSITNAFHKYILSPPVVRIIILSNDLLVSFCNIFAEIWLALPMYLFKYKSFSLLFFFLFFFNLIQSSVFVSVYHIYAFISRDIYKNGLY